ncbi:MAG TPA: M56 family metallopeptidase, partial [Clostridia bacterium]|nr:M56 family metallopeptidase [Clostridia bacterium]
HEKTHIKRFDHIAKIVSFLVLCVHWFNPLVWAAFFLSGKDMEMSCDERVIKSLGDGVKRDYSYSLLSLATGKRILGAAPLAFGEGETRGRVKNVLNYRKPSFWMIAVAVMICLAAAAMLMTDPKTPQTESNEADAVKYSDVLDDAVSKAILNIDEMNHSDFATESHVILGTEASGQADDNTFVSINVYAMAMTMEYDYSDGWFVNTAGSHMPVAITFDVNEEGEYVLNEYWMPMDGSGYGPSIKEKFPSYLYNDAIDTQKYVYGQIMNCYDDAIRHGELDKAHDGNRI